MLRIRRETLALFRFALNGRNAEILKTGLKLIEDGEARAHSGIADGEVFRR